MEPEEPVVARQQFGKRVSEATDTEATNQEVLGRDVFYMVRTKWL
jgi:hypothetical protein